MELSSRSRKTPSVLTNSARRRLDMYALAASAAGIGAIASVQPSEAKVVYTPAHHVIGEGQKYALTLNHTHADFLLVNNQCLFPHCTSSISSAYLAVENAGPAGKFLNGAVGSGAGWAMVLKRGAEISKHSPFYPGRLMASECGGPLCNESGTNGPWVDVSDRYLGLKFKIDGKYHYGWARLNVTVVKGAFRITPTLTGYAYETVPGKPIVAGDTGGPDADIMDPDTTPGSLAGLAKGRK
jgi:hypothetical protein